MWWYESQRALTDTVSSSFFFSPLFVYGTFTLCFIGITLVAISVASACHIQWSQVIKTLAKEKNRTLTQQAVEDNLTRLYNRHALNTYINKKLEHLYQDPDEAFSVLFIDLDRFKIINDSMGHLIGDLVLKQVANRLLLNARKQDSCYRFGGDEFVICLPGMHSQQTLARIARRYADLISEPYNIEEKICQIGVSVGIATVSDSSYTLDKILREADTAMYRAKKSEDSKVVFFDNDMFVQATRRFTFEQELSFAIEREQLFLKFQPIFSNDGEEMVSVEVLLRWSHPDNGWVSPADFIPIAEEAGLINKIGDWVIEKTCYAVSQLCKNHSIDELPRFNVNVSAKQFINGQVLHSLNTHLARYECPAKLIGVEITETSLLSDSKLTISVLKSIKALGITISLDDFGTGYSSLAMLNHCPIDVVKMDRSFVSHVADIHHRSAHICFAIINMAHAIDISVVAEGVETLEQLNALKSFHCDYVQGFLTAKPMSLEELELFFMDSTLSKKIA
ncbi:bifunctional diguanylate cyclase/phosphodiesterase [Vibrio vulnificus]|nr:bifunctional diguanylate cyclase/phosphodiesterase [Vibrio vulnificus]